MEGGGGGREARAPSRGWSSKAHAGPDWGGNKGRDARSRRRRGRAPEAGPTSPPFAASSRGRGGPPPTRGASLLQAVSLARARPHLLLKSAGALPRPGKNPVGWPRLARPPSP